VSRRTTVVAGVLALALAAWLRPVPTTARATTLGAIGASMGGARVMLIDALFLRAEALRRAGRIEDAADLYRTVLELDPANQAAILHLVGTYVDEILPQGVDLADRFAWWQAARALLLHALRLHPDAPRLHHRMAVLILDAGDADPALVPLIAKALGTPRRIALRHLRQALRATATLPREGRTHLVRAALLAPTVAARALRDGDRAGLREALGTIHDLLALRAPELHQMLLDEESEHTLEELVRTDLAAVEAVRDADGSAAGRARAEAAIRASDRLLPGRELPGLLRQALQRGR
jgi:tetratricopeptide (TPR) repeat protein